jgi:hypothetical protein
MLAQLVEQWTFNPLVGSSNLPRPTSVFEEWKKSLLGCSSIGRATGFDPVGFEFESRRPCQNMAR